MRVYNSKYDNEVRSFFLEVAPNNSLVELAKVCEVTYQDLHYNFKNNRVTFKLFVKMVTKLNLNVDQSVRLSKLVVAQN